MNRKLLCIIVNALLLLSLFIISISCSAQPTNSSKSGATISSTVTSISTPKEQTIEMKYASFQPTTSRQHKIFQTWVEEVYRRTNGRLKVTIFPAESLGKAAQGYDIALVGAADFSYVVPSYNVGKFPLTDVVTLPFILPTDRITNALWEVFKENPEIQQEYSPVKVLAMWTSATLHLCTNKQPVRTIADLNGMQIRVPNTATGNLFTSLGAKPVFIPVVDCYIPMQKGTVDGVTFGYAGLITYKLVEVTKYVTNMGISMSSGVFVINPRSWDLLPEDIQQLIGPEGDLGGDWIVSKICEGFNADDLAARDNVQKAGIEIITLSSADTMKLQGFARPMHEDWIKEMNAKGLPGQKIFDSVLRIAATAK